MYDQLIAIIDVLESDATLQTLLSGTAANKKIYPEVPDKFEDFPCVTWSFIEGEYNTVPSNTEKSELQFNIYSKLNVKQVEDISERINALLNYYKEAQSGTRVIYMKRVLVTSANETDRAIFGKIVRYDIWTRD